MDTPEQGSPGVHMGGVHACSPIVTSARVALSPPTLMQEATTRELFPPKQVIRNRGVAPAGGKEEPEEGGVGRAGVERRGGGSRGNGVGGGGRGNRGRSGAVVRASAKPSTTASVGAPVGTNPALEQELQLAYNMIERLEQSVDYLKLRTKV